MTDAPALVFRIGAQSSVGRVRAHNEDTYAVRQDLGLAVVCDGMGGHERGEVASDLATRTIVEIIESAPRPVCVTAASELLAHAEQANERVHDAGGGVVASRRMGTTVVALWFVDRHAIIAHVGDSRCYRLHAGVLHRLTADHTFLEDARRAQLGPIDEAMAHHFAHALTRSVGHGPACVLDLATCPIAPDDRFLLCSDGLTGMVGDAEIAEILAAAETPELAAARLADTANEHGGNDNVTAVVAWKTR